MSKSVLLSFILTMALVAAACKGPVGATGTDGEDLRDNSYLLTPTSIYNQRAVCYGGGSIVSVGESGNAAYKTAGTAWTEVSVAEGTIFNALAYGNGAFVAVGASGAAYYSTDGGITWEAATDSGTITAYNLVDIAYGASCFVAVANNGDGSGALISSEDGRTWTNRTPSDLFDNPMFCSVDFANGRFVAGVESGGGYVYESADGVNWGTAISLGAIEEAIVGVSYGNGIYLALGSAGAMMKSGDATTWTSVDAFDISSTYAGIAFDGQHFTILTRSGSVYATMNAESWTIYPSLMSLADGPYYSCISWTADYAGGAYLVARYIL